MDAASTSLPTERGALAVEERVEPGFVLLHGIHRVPVAHENVFSPASRVERTIESGPCQCLS